MAPAQTRAHNIRTPVARGLPSFDLVLPDFSRDLSCAATQDASCSSECALEAVFGASFAPLCTLSLRQSQSGRRRSRRCACSGRSRLNWACSTAAALATRKSWSGFCIQWSTKECGYWKKGSQIAAATFTSSGLRAFGFPDHRGGPMFMAHRIGQRQIAERLKAYGSKNGDEYSYWEVSPLLARHAADDQRVTIWRAGA